MASAASLSSRGLAYGLVALVGTIALYFFGFSKGIEVVTQASRERADNQAKIEALKKKISDLRSLEAQFSQAQNQVNALSVAMPAEKQMAEIVIMLETMAARAGVLLENVQPTQSTSEGVPLAISVRGSFAGILKFAELMEKNVRPISLGPFNISSGENDLSTTFNVVFLYQVPSSDLPAGQVVPPEGGT